MESFSLMPGELMAQGQANQMDQATSDLSPKGSTHACTHVHARTHIHKKKSQTWWANAIGGTGRKGKFQLGAWRFGGAIGQVAFNRVVNGMVRQWNGGTSGLVGQAEGCSACTQV